MSQPKPKPLRQTMPSVINPALSNGVDGGAQMVLVRAEGAK